MNTARNFYLKAFSCYVSMSLEIVGRELLILLELVINNLLTNYLHRRFFKILFFLIFCPSVRTLFMILTHDSIFSLISFTFDV